MNARERILAIIVGVGLGGFALYHAANFFFFEAITKAEQDLESLQEEQSELHLYLASREDWAREWNDDARRTFSFDGPKAKDRFGAALKDLAREHGFENAVFNPSSGTKIGAKTKIYTVAHRIGIEGDYDDVMGFVRSLYKTPYLTQITKLQISAIESKDTRGLVKLDLTIETPVLPEIIDKAVPEVAAATPMDQEDVLPTTPARKYLRDDDALALLAERNIFREYMPPPVNMVMIDNQDWKTVALKVKFYWDNKVEEQLTKTVASKSTLSVQGKGAIVEIEGAYADGAEIKPQRFDFTRKKDWQCVVAVHHDPPPPETIDLAIDNKTDDKVFLEMTITTKDNEQLTEPVMVFEPGRSDIRAYTDVVSINVTAKYASGKYAKPKTFKPREGKQTYTVGAENVDVVVDKQPVNDPPADPQMAVTGLLAYAGNQEMIASDGASRTVIAAGEDGAVDGGTLLAVHPLGGVVQMPTGNYYIYPLGKKFTERVLLTANDETQLAAAIDAWSRQ